MNNVKKLQQCCAIVCCQLDSCKSRTRDSRLATLIDNKLVHTTGTESRRDSLRNSKTCRNVAQQLPSSLRCIGALCMLVIRPSNICSTKRTTQEYNRWLLEISTVPNHPRHCSPLKESCPASWAGFWVVENRKEEVVEAMESFRALDTSR